MSTPAVEEIISLENQLRDGLMALGKLTPEDANLIEQTMSTTGLGYADAAIHLGLATPADLEDIAGAERQPLPKTHDSVVERAFSKMTLKRGLPVKYVGIAKAAESLMLLSEPDSTYSEQIRALRTELLLLLNQTAHVGSTLVVLSTRRGEGRSQLCAELAVAFSQLGQRTLLVDADLRHSRMQALFEPRNAFDGLGQALATTGIPELLSVDKLPHLSLVLAGASVPNPLELLTNGQLQRQITDWGKKFNMIIIDTPPVSEFADGLAVASFAEQVLIVGRSGSTPHKDIKDMMRRMGRTRTKIIGSVINYF